MGTSYPKVIGELKRARDLGRRCRCRAVPYLNNILEQDHRAIKRRVSASQRFRSFDSAARTIQGIETVNMIRKGQVRWLANEDVEESRHSVGTGSVCARIDSRRTTYIGFDRI